jgi:hypothetical protein
MATGVILDSLAQARVEPLRTALQRDFGVDTTQKELINALVFGATAAQAVGMLSAFTRARAARDALQQPAGDDTAGGG